MNEQPHALAVLDQEQAIQGVKVLASIVRQLRESVFVQGSDYGTIPGAGDKPVLLLPGMEKLQRALSLRAEYVEREKRIDFDSGLFYFEYECRLTNYDSGVCVSTAIGSANSYESKWRWRDAKRACPSCGKETINRSKFPPKQHPDAEPGWYCYAKIGGCGAEYAAADERITAQTVGRIQNPDIADQLNTICKIAQKRALASAIKGAANVSEFFTVDLDDLPFFPQKVTAQTDNVIDGEFVEAPAAIPTASDAAFDAIPRTAAELAASVGANGREIAPTPTTTWTEVDIRAFVKSYRSVGITDAEVLEALGVGGLKAFTGTTGDAQSALDAYIARQLAVDTKGEAS